MDMNTDYNRFVHSMYYCIYASGAKFSVNYVLKVTTTTTLYLIFTANVFWR